MPLSAEVLYKIIDKITDFHDKTPAFKGSYKPAFAL